MKIIEIIPKIEVTNKKLLSLVYTPGVAKSSLEIYKNYDKVFDLTNRSNSIAVMSGSYDESLKRAIFLKEKYFIDAYPLEISSCEKTDVDFVVENIMPNFMGVDTVLMNNQAWNSENVIATRSKGCFLPDGVKYEDIEAIELRRMFQGVVETRVIETLDSTNTESLIAKADIQKKPIAIISDGSAVLGLGNIGAEAALPVMEGKSVLFKSLGCVNAVPLCLKTQVPSDIERIAYLLQNSFSGINLEDISAPRCFEIEQNLIEKLDIPVFHDDQHGTAIVVLGGLLNALKVVGKSLDEVKIIFSGAGAAGQAISKLLLKAGACNIVMFDKNGIIYKGRKSNDDSLEAMAEITNKTGLKDSLCEVIKGADVFIGVSTKDILTPVMVKTMADKAIIFAIANPEPEILPTEALKAGALIAASGRSDFNNQINNSLVFPGLFKGILESGLKVVSDEVKIETALALAEIVKDKELSCDYIIPDALDILVAKNISACIIDYVRNKAR